MKRQRVLVLVHKHLVPPDDTTGIDLVSAEWKTEYDVITTLREHGHEVKPLGIQDELNPIRQHVEEWKPTIVFNLLEAFDNVNLFDQNVVSYLELLRVPYTGCNPRGLLLSRDKSLSKKLMAYHRIPVPEFAVFPRGRKVRVPPRLQFPLIVKSLTHESSIGISQASVVGDEEKLRKRVEFIHDSVGTHAIVERYIDGRELYVGVMGNERLQVFPVWEMHFSKMVEGDNWPIATERVKWSTKYQKKHGIATEQGRRPRRRVRRRSARWPSASTARSSSPATRRIDLRMDNEGRMYVLEANPNPQIAYGEDFAESATPCRDQVRRLARPHPGARPQVEAGGDRVNSDGSARRPPARLGVLLVSSAAARRHRRGARGARFGGGPADRRRQVAVLSVAGARGRRRAARWPPGSGHLPADRLDEGPGGRTRCAGRRGGMPAQRADGVRAPGRPRPACAAAGAGCSMSRRSVPSARGPTGFRRLVGAHGVALRRDRRGALHQPVGSRLPARVPAAGRAAPGVAGRVGARVHGDGDDTRAARHHWRAGPARPGRARRPVRPAEPHLSRAAADDAEIADPHAAGEASARGRHHLLPVAEGSGRACPLAGAGRRSRASLSRWPRRSHAAPAPGCVPQRGGRRDGGDGRLRHGHRSIGRALRAARGRAPLARALSAGSRAGRPRWAARRVRADHLAQGTSRAGAACSSPAASGTTRSGC